MLLQKLQELREAQDQRVNELSFADTLCDTYSSDSLCSEAPEPANPAKPTEAPEPVTTNQEPEPKPVSTEPPELIPALWRLDEPETKQTATEPITTNQEPEPTEAFEPIIDDGYDSVTETETEDDPYLEDKDLQALGLVVRPIATAARNFSSQKLRSSQDAQVLCSNSWSDSVANEAMNDDEDDDDFGSISTMVTWL